MKRIGRIADQNRPRRHWPPGTLPLSFWAAPAVVIGLDAAGTIVSCSLDPDHDWGMTIADFGLDIDPSRFDRALSGETVKHKISLKGPKGAQRWYDLMLCPWPPRGVMLYVVDITTHERTQRALHFNKARLHRLLAVIPYGIAYIDLEGRLVLTNAAHDVMLGYDPGETQGRLIWEFFDEEERQKQQENFFHSIKARPMPVPNYGKVLRKDGSLLDVLYHWTYETDETGKLVGFISITTDITRELIAKKELEIAKAEAERTRDEKSRFLAAASHDLQQPLHSLSIMLGLLKENHNKARREEILTQMELAMEGAQALLGAVLELSKLEARVVKPRLEPITVSELFAQLAADFIPQFMHSPVILKIHPTRLIIESDRVLLKSILHNLLSNALRYTEQGKVLLVARRRGASVLLQVWDTGIGIPEDKQKEIFREFTRLRPEHQVVGQTHALGLGLSIVERACELLGHKITLRSRLHKGSVFSLEVPFLAVDTSERAKVVRAPYSAQPHKILIIEDDYRQAKNTKDLFASWGYTAVIARNRTQAQTAVKQLGQPFDLILADYNLQQGDNGISIAMDICKALRKKLPIILMTAESDPQVYQFAGANGIEVLAKPARPARLRALMDFVLATKGGV